MVIIVVIAARDVGFKPAQWAALIGATDRPGGAVRLDHQLGRPRRGADASGAAGRHK